MPHTQSAGKRMRQNAKRRLHNRQVASRLKTAIDRVSQAIQGGDAAKVSSALRLAVSLIDRAGARGLLHRNTAARRKSGLMRLAIPKKA